jgi:hypothetical protein
MTARDELSMLIHGEVGKLEYDKFVPVHEVFLLLCKITEPKRVRYLFWKYIQESLDEVREELSIPESITEEFNSLTFDDDKLVMLAQFTIGVCSVEPATVTVYLCRYKVMREEWSKIDASASNLCRSERPADHSADDGSA